MEKPIVFKNKSGKQLIGILHLPEGKGRFPLAVICHGFGATKSRRRIVELARDLEKKEIVAFRFDFEGCGDSQGDLKNATIRNEISDLELAIKKISRQKNIDKRRITLISESFGSAIVLLYLAQNKILAKTLVFWAPAFNQRKLIPVWFTKSEIKKWQKQGYFIRKEKIMGINYFKENKDKDYSFLLSKIKVPILILHGRKDETVPVEFSKKLAQNCKNIKLKIYPKAEHNFENYYIQKELIKDTADWIKKYL